MIWKCIHSIQGLAYPHLQSFMYDTRMNEEWKHHTICLQAEDKVDELARDLLLTRHRVQATEEEKRGKEEEAEMVRVKISISVKIL